MIQSGYPIKNESNTMKPVTKAQLAKELREHYREHPPESMTSDEVCDMSDEELLDMDYFFHEFDDFDDVVLGYK